MKRGAALLVTFGSLGLLGGCGPKAGDPDTVTLAVKAGNDISVSFKGAAKYVVSSEAAYPTTSSGTFAFTGKTASGQTYTCTQDRGYSEDLRSQDVRVQLDAMRMKGGITFPKSACKAG